MKKRQVRKHNNNKQNKKRRTLRPEVLIIIVFVMSLAFYCTTKIGLNSYNITLQQSEQALAAEVSQKKEAVSELETEVNNLQNKTRLLGMLDSSVKDNQNNIYIME